MRQLTLTLIAGLLISLVGAAGKDGGAITARQHQDNSCALFVELQQTGPSSDPLGAYEAHGGSSIDGYQLYVIYSPDTPDVIACDESKNYLDASRTGPISACMSAKQADAAKKHLSEPTLRCPQGSLANLMGTVEIPLLLPLRSDLEYVLRRNIPGAPIDTKINETVAITLVDPSNKKELAISSTVAIKASHGDPISIKADLQSEHIPKVFSAIVSAINPDGVVLTLSTAIPATSGGQPTQISTDDLADYYGTKVSVKGSFPTSGATQSAPPPKTPNGTTTTAGTSIQTTVTAEAGVHEKPIFTFVGGVEPWDTAAHAIWLDKSDVRFDPSVNYDIGFNSTQSANSVIMPAPFTYWSLSALPSSDNQVKADSAGITPQAIKMSFGPRVELDQTFHRLNLLGEVRGDFYLASLSNSVTNKQARYKQANPGYHLPLPTNGFVITPYAQFDTGGHIFSQTVTDAKGNESVTVPAYGINRFYAGLSASAQVSIITLTLDSSYVDLISRETIGYTTTTGAFLRKLDGWQPHTKLVVNFALNKAKTLALSLTYEDGRSEPNFQYLNKFDAGLQVTH